MKPIDEPAGQTEIAATFGPEDMIHGNVAIGSRTNQPGTTELRASLPHLDTDNTYVVGYCRASEDVWWVSTGTYGECSPDAPLEATPPVEFQPGGNAPWPLPEPAEQPDMETPVDMWLTEPLSEQARECITGQIVADLMREECFESDPGVTLLDSADATFGFTAYVHSGPQVVDDALDPGGPSDPGGGFEALANLDGTE